MINILSIKCDLAFAPYLVESMAAFLETGETRSQVIRQAASGFIIRSEEALFFRHQNRESALVQKEAEHYYATIRFRQEVYDVSRKSDEVVLANVGNLLLLSHPQSELWLDAGTIPALLVAFHRTGTVNNKSLPDWLTLSGGDGRLLISDQRNGRWVLLGSDHFAELERRYELLKASLVLQAAEKAPTISLKGLTIHLQAALNLQGILEKFAHTGAFQPYEELAPTYQLIVRQAVEGMKIYDGNLSVAMTAKEAHKWAAILKTELEKYRVRQLERGGIRTVIASVEEGQWILQWGDEVFIAHQELKQFQAQQFQNNPLERLAIKQEREFLLLLDQASGGCVALTKAEAGNLFPCQKPIL